jgi:hypothetical protein
MTVVQLEIAKKKLRNRRNYRSVYSSSIKLKEVQDIFIQIAQLDPRRVATAAAIQAAPLAAAGVALAALEPLAGTDGRSNRKPRSRKFYSREPIWHSR